MVSLEHKGPENLVGPTASPPAPPPPRKRKTHIPALAELIKTLPLQLKLKKNKEIEKQNDARMEKHLQHLKDPSVFPDDASDAASFITLDKRDMLNLEDQDYFSLVKDRVPLYIIDELDARDKKRKHSAAMDEDQLHLDKRRCMDGKLMISSYEAAFYYEFHRMFFQTANNNIHIPLSFFLTKNLQYIVANFATMPTCRVKSQDGSKGPYVLDISAMTKDREGRFGGTFKAEGDICHSGFRQAGEHMVAFEIERDKDRERDLRVQAYKDHFSFFTLHWKAVDLYDFWKDHELYMRQQLMAGCEAFTRSEYEQVMDVARNAHNLATSLRNPPSNTRRKRFRRRKKTPTF